MNPKKPALTYAERVHRYAKDVVDGTRAAGQWVKAAARRQQRDLLAAETDPAYPYTFDAKAVQRICRFAENMVHIKGKWAQSRGKELPYIHLEDWQVFLLGTAFGWIRKADGRRRFREIYAEIPRKNAKSTLGAIIGLYMTCADGEMGAEVYAGATTQEQSYQVFRPAWLMVQKNPDFKKHFGLQLGGTERNPGNIFQLSTHSRFEALIGKPGDGASPHCAVVDEYHEHSGPELYDAMKTGMGARTQPMRVVITTAGANTSGPCYEKHLDALKVLEGSLDNPELFTLIYGIDVGTEAEPGDDWTHFPVWQKANPNYGVSIFEDYLRGQLRDALQSPSQQNIILTKNLNQWMSVGAAWMNMAAWERQRDPDLHLDHYAGQPCWLGLDLASKIDIASLAILFKTAAGGIDVFCKHYLPAETIALPHNSHYRRWRDEGWLTETDGARTDFRYVEEDLKALAGRFAVQELAFDQRETNYLIAQVQTWAGFTCVEVPQAPAHFNEPMKEMEAQIYAGTLHHNGDPVLTWMMSNTIRREARGGPVKYAYPTKSNEKNKIDGVVAAIMALSRAMAPQQAPPEYQVY